ncbi:1-phosphatidylinositol 4,5-bisphosphate phosphodiesterase delta-1-like isoform X1 [Styela clava]
MTMTTTDLDEWIRNLQTTEPPKVYYGRDGRPSSRPVLEPAPRRNIGNKPGNKYRPPRNIKNAEGTNTDSFYYVGMDEIEEYDNWPVHAQNTPLNLKYEETGRDNFDLTVTDRPDKNLLPEISEFRGFAIPNRARNSENVRKSPKSRDVSRKQHNNPIMRSQYNTNQNTNKNLTGIDQKDSQYVTENDVAIVALPDIPDSTPAPHVNSAPVGHQSPPEKAPLTVPESRRPASSVSSKFKAENVFSRRNSTMPETRRVPLPKSILNEIAKTIPHDVLNAINTMQDGESLLMVDHSRWVTRTVNTDCYVTPDMIHVTFVRRRCWMPSVRCCMMEDTFDIRDILMARAGKDGLLRVIDKDLPEIRCFSIVFEDNSQKAINFVAPSAESAKYWVKWINYIKKKLENLIPRLKHELFLWEIFKKADVNGDGLVSYQEIMELLHETGVPVLGRNFQELFHKHVFNRKIDEMSFDGFKHFHQEMTLRPEVQEIFRKYSADGAMLTARELYKFLQDQGEAPEKSQDEYDVTEQDCYQIIDDYEMDDDNRENKKMTVHGFAIFLASTYCDVFNKRHDEVYQDMKHPLSHYFIASSHNTYLTGDQLKDPSSTDAYMKALLQGCRCVELDCWDGADGEPVIYHGYTFTSKIKFKDTIEVIGKYAFEVSRYPLILSIENHCSVQQQEKMAEYMKKILGTELLTDYVIPESDEFHLPSPDALLGKILIKGKKLPPPVHHDDGDTSSDDDVSDEDEAAEMEVMMERMHLRKPMNRLERLFRRRDTSSDDVTRKCDESVKQLFGAHCVDNGQTVSLATPSNSNQSSTRTRAQEKKLKLSKYLSDQVIYCKSTKFKGVDHGIQKSQFKEISSFSENKATRLATQQKQEAINYHVEHLNRTYPGGTRADSSNYDPQPLWNAGFQVVALNYQTKCDEMVLYHGKFRQNGRCGYILKPEYMRSLTDDITRETHGETAKHLKITVIRGFRIPVDLQDGDVSLQIDVSVTGDTEDVAKERTRIVKTNGYNPVWNDDVEFLVRIPSLAMVWFVIRDEDSDKIAQFVLPLSSVGQGYRTVHLLDKDGTPMRSTSLLLYVSVNDAT